MKIIRDPLISVIIPTFNRKVLVQGAIYNALEQSYDNIEVIVVEDGSRSGVDKFIKDLGDDRVIYTSHSNNCGVGASRNHGMSLASGEYIAFLDDDDRWLKEKLKLQLDVINKCKNNKSMVYCFNAVSKNKKFSKKNMKSARGLMSDYIFKGYLLPSSSMMIKRSSLVFLGGYSEKLKSCVDHDMWMTLARNGFDMDFVEEGMIYSVKDKRKRMVNQFDDRLEGVRQFFNKWRPEIIEEYKIESWLKIERKYHIQTSYGIVDSYRKGFISKDEGINYLKDLFLMQSNEFSWLDMFLAQFGLRFSTRLFNCIPMKNALISYNH